MRRPHGGAGRGSSQPYKPPMTWWRQHGGTVAMCAALWVVFNDPIARWLPVPMPELEPGPRTTWLADPPMRQGLPDYAAAIDAEDAERLAAGAEARDLLEQILAAAEDGTTLGAYLEGLEVGPDGRGDAAGTRAVAALAGGTRPVLPRDAAQIPRWEERCAAALDRLLGLPPTATLALPTLALPEAGWQLAPVRSPSHLLALLHLASAAEHRGRRSLAGDAIAALTQAERLARLAAITAGIGDIPAHNAALGMRTGAWRLALDAIGARPHDAALRARADALLAATPALPAAERGLRILRLLSLRVVLANDRGIRDGRRMPAMRANRPPDVNEALRLLNAWFDRIDRAVPRPLDGAGMDALPGPAELEGLASPGRPLANRMLFAEPMAERRRESARAVAMAASSIAWLALQALRAQAGEHLRARRVLLAVLAVPVGDDADAYARQMRDRLDAGTDGGPLDVTVDGAVVTVRASRPTAADGPEPSGRPRPKLQDPLFRIDLASQP